MPAQGKPANVLVSMRTPDSLLHAAGRGGSVLPPSEKSTIGFEPLLDCVEAARLLRMHPKTLERKARQGQIPGIHLGRHWRFRASVLNQWLEEIAS